MKDYSILTFGKSLNDLTYEDIVLFFQEEREESNILEFKSGQDNAQKFDDILNKKVIRGIASFLNSEGGILIWGSPIEHEVIKANKKVKIASGELEPNLVFNGKDQLINKIIRTISYMPTGVRLKTLNNGEKFVYVFEVDESTSKPHQYKNEYLIRIDGQTLPAPHYFVDSMFNQIKFPEIDGRINFKSVNIYHNTLVIEIDILIFNKSPFINERNLSFQLVVTGGIIIKSNHWQYFSGDHKVLHYGRPYLESHVLRFDNYTDKNTINILLSFGGELGPALVNSYEIDTSNLVSGNFKFKDYIKNHSENISFKSKQESLGKTHEENMSIHLNRD